ncbi:MAG: hypothetical protein JSW23_08560 [Planctomycetota bacterium]|nr:MAG: hypothetical protein JSW23_08560 [Planctomycetota bacterium]
MAWALIILIVLICAVALVARIYSPRSKAPEGTSQTPAGDEGDGGGDGDGE